MSNFKDVIQLFYVLIYFVDGSVKIWNVGPKMDVVSGSTLILTCTGDSKLIWYFEGINIYSSDFKSTDIRINRLFKSTLKIDNIKFNDTGFYFCVSDDFSHQSVYVFVNDKKHLFLPQETDLIHMNHNAETNIPCRPTFSSLNVTLWRYNEQVPIDKSVVFDPRSGFFIHKSIDFSGFFWCKAKYEDHTEILTFNLIHNINSNFQLPLIDSGPVIDIPKNSTIKLKCRGKRMTYWLIPENTRFGNSRWKYSFFYDINADMPYIAMIEVTDAQTSDSGSLKCCYKYRCMTEQFSSVFLRVNDPEILYIPKIKPILTKELQCVPYIIQCLPSMSNITVQLQFSKVENSSSIQKDLNKDFSYYSTLGFIPNDYQKFRKQYSSGKFFCEFKYENFSQRIERSILSLVPRYSMEITSLNKTPIEGDDVDISCEGCKFTFKNITWKWKGNNQTYFIPVLNSLSGIKLFDESTTYKLKKVLKIENINMENAGKYECVGITQDNMEETQDINLKIKAIEKPTFVNTNMNGSNVTIMAGKKFEFICVVHGEPYPTITWYKNDQIIAKTYASGIHFDWNFLKLIINRVSKRNSGIYRCEARNRGGQIFAELSLNVTTETTKMIKEKVTSSLSAIVISFTIICALLAVGLLFVILLIIKYKRNSKSYF